MDAKFAALRKQNQEDIIKQERRLSMARTEEREILRGQEVFVFFFCVTLLCNKLLLCMRSGDRCR